MRWPHGKNFAFTIFDDTDLAVPGNFERTYDCLGELGFRTTKSVWPLTSPGQLARDPEGSSCDDPEYLQYVLQLQRQGFEIGYHNSSHTGFSREGVVRALDRFRELFGHDPHTMTNHQQNPEAMYWGAARLSQPWRSAYRLAQRGAMAESGGHDPASPHFWGDICAARIRYVRSFVFPEVNTLAACPATPYHDPARPYVRAWFASTFASWWRDFAAALAPERQDELAASGGACIIYTHIGAEFQDLRGGLRPEFRALMKRLAALNGWFVPVHQLLDYMVEQQGLATLSFAQRQAQEWRWLRHKLRVRGTE